MANSVAEESEQFLAKVESCADKIQKLLDGSITVEDIDKDERKEASIARGKKISEEEENYRQQQRVYMGREGKGETHDYVCFCKACFTEYTYVLDTCRRCTKPVISKDERHKYLQSKVAELKLANKKKLERKERWERWKKSSRYLRVNQELGHYQSSSRPTDYDMWANWEEASSEDEGTEPIIPKDSAEFKALEANIEDSHRRQKERLVAAKRCKERGNECAKRNDYWQALQHYNEGIELKKDFLDLHNNKLFALIMLNQFLEALKSSEVILSLFELKYDWTVEELAGQYQESNTKLATQGCDSKQMQGRRLSASDKLKLAKVFYRRSLANKALDRWDISYTDIEMALIMEPDNNEIRKLHSVLSTSLSQLQKEKLLQNMHTKLNPYQPLYDNQLDDKTFVSLQRNIENEISVNNLPQEEFRKILEVISTAPNATRFLLFPSKQISPLDGEPKGYKSRPIVHFLKDVSETAEAYRLRRCKVAHKNNDDYSLPASCLKSILIVIAIFRRLSDKSSVSEHIDGDSLYEVFYDATAHVIRDTTNLIHLTSTYFHHKDRTDCHGNSYAECPSPWDCQQCLFLYSLNFLDVLCTSKDNCETVSTYLSKLPADYLESLFVPVHYVADANNNVKTTASISCHYCENSFTVAMHIISKLATTQKVRQILVGDKLMESDLMKSIKTVISICLKKPEKSKWQQLGNTVITVLVNLAHNMKFCLQAVTDVNLLSNLTSILQGATIRDNSISNNVLAFFANIHNRVQDSQSMKFIQTRCCVQMSNLYAILINFIGKSGSSDEDGVATTRSMTVLSKILVYLTTAPVLNKRSREIKTDMLETVVPRILSMFEYRFTTSDNELNKLEAAARLLARILTHNEDIQSSLYHAKFKTLQCGRIDFFASVCKKEGTLSGESEHARSQNGRQAKIVTGIDILTTVVCGLLRKLASPTETAPQCSLQSGIRGNLCFIVSKIAEAQASTESMSLLEAIPLLINALSIEKDGSSQQKNAGIALTRIAQLERYKSVVREQRGFEALHQVAAKALLEKK